MKHHSLQARLLWRTLGGVLMVWLLTLGVVWWEAQHELDELLDAHLAQAAALLVVQQAQAETENGDENEATRADAPVLHKYAPRVAYQVFDHGQLTLHSPNASHQPMVDLRQGFATVVLEDGLPWRVFAASGNEKATQVYVAEQLQSRNDILWAVVRGFLVPLVVVVPLLLLGLWWLVRQSLQPLQRLRQMLLARDVQALAPVDMADAPQEVQPLINALNALLSRLAQRLETEQRFTADAAHELRTPIAAIRAQAQVALGAADAAQADTRMQALQATLAGCDRAARVVEQLLTLARLENQTLTATQSVALPVVLQEVAAALTPQALRRGQQLELSAPTPLQANGHPVLWEILLRNLLDNALRYSPEGATVRVQAHALEGGGIEVRVQDSGPGLSESDMLRLGERFFRVLGTQASGSGLGWSIVRRIAQVLNLRVQLARSTELGGLCVRVCSA